LRASGIPAQLKLGLKYGSDIQDACGVFVASHAESEFFAEGIGWVPCDATLGAPSSFGHRGGSKSSFIGWHGATMSFAESRETGELMRSSDGLSGGLAKLRKICAKKISGDHSAEPDRKALAEALALSFGIDSDAARRQVDGIFNFCKEALGEDTKITLEVFLTGFEAFEIGKCPIHLGYGKSICSTAMVGAKLFEGGPFEADVPLGLEELKECIMVPKGHEKLMEAVNDGSFNLRDQFCASGGRGCIIFVDFTFQEEPLEN